MAAVNYVIYVCSSPRTTAAVVTIQKLHTGGKTLLQLLHKIGWVIDDNLKSKLKSEPCILDYFY